MSVEFNCWLSMVLVEMRFKQSTQERQEHRATFYILKLEFQAQLLAVYQRPLALYFDIIMGLAWDRVAVLDT